MTESSWYRVPAFSESFPPDSPVVDRLGGDLQIIVSVFAHTTPSDPNSGFGVGTLLGNIEFVRRCPRSGRATGFVGIAGWARSAVINSTSHRANGAGIYAPRTVPSRHLGSARSIVTRSRSSVAM